MADRPYDFFDLAVFGNHLLVRGVNQSGRVFDRVVIPPRPGRTLRSPSSAGGGGPGREQGRKSRFRRAVRQRYPVRRTPFGTPVR